ncbi:uncharacterized protein CLUP02_00628 [Colletotrichum lupini]|uniref:Uncharacterized protein n=1 Tax=Colletotrichum lupini TaxID=145971 RepID=A0A9Q8SAQ9_9PEZI|nr:uncharacterized protein CLUP02_00628 [Colletotrichum lupini]UQC73981.1 hypothetical protein CLUP02_00628 [Colletotrichum lupini]
MAIVSLDSLGTAKVDGGISAYPCGSPEPFQDYLVTLVMQGVSFSCLNCPSHGGLKPLKDIPIVRKEAEDDPTHITSRRCRTAPLLRKAHASLILIPPQNTRQRQQVA